VVLLLSSSGRVRGSLVKLTKADDDEVRNEFEGVEEATVCENKA
jgi:hypothetical protein